MARKSGPHMPPGYKKKLLERTRKAREAVQYLYPTMRDFEQAMDLPPDTWKQYETRSPLPPYLVERFCTLTGASAWELFTGKHAASQPKEPIKPPPPQDRRRHAA